MSLVFRSVKLLQAKNIWATMNRQTEVNQSLSPKTNPAQPLRQKLYSIRRRGLFNT